MSEYTENIGTRLFKDNGTEQDDQRSINDLHNLISEKLFWLEVARDLLKENGLIDEFRRRITR